MRKVYNLTRKAVSSSIHTEDNIEIVDEKDAEATSNINLIFIWFILWYQVTLQIRTVRENDYVSQDKKAQQKLKCSPQSFLSFGNTILQLVVRINEA